MKRLQMLKGVIVGLVGWGIVCPPPQVMAASPRPVVRTEAPAAPIVTDVTLSAGGTLTGQVVDGQGIGIDGALVSLRQSGQEVAQTLTNGEGRFSVTNLRGGTYEIATGQQVAIYRCWAPNTAPPAAKSNVLLVSDNTTARGQYGPGVDVITISTLVLGGLAAGFAIAAYTRIDDVDDKVDRIEKSLASP